jgi:NADH dehydrogenase
MNDAIRLKEHILKAFEAVDKNPALVDDGALNFCVVGGGPTGVELAGALVELLHAELTKDYPNLPVEKAQVLLYEHSPNLLGTFAPRLEGYARKALEERGGWERWDRMQAWLVSHRETFTAALVN